MPLQLIANADSSYRTNIGCISSLVEKQKTRQDTIYLFSLLIVVWYQGHYQSPACHHLV
jgi:hypothetical protein